LDRGLYTATSGMLVQELKLDYTANNLANVNTFGYKANVGAVKSFPQLLVHRINETYLKVSGVENNMDLRPLIGLSTMGAVVDEIATDFSKGELSVTGNDFDLALDGKGFFVVETPYGERMTRAGNFTMNANMELVTKEGFRVMGRTGPIRLDGNNFRVDENGAVFVGERADEYVDMLKIVTVDDYETIKKVGHNLFMVPRSPREPETLLEKNEYERTGELQENPQPHITEDVVVRQGVLEGSNVNAVLQLRSMIDIMRIYEANSKVVTTKDSLLGSAATNIGQIR